MNDLAITTKRKCSLDHDRYKKGIAASIKHGYHINHVITCPECHECLEPEYEVNELQRVMDNAMKHGDVIDYKIIRVDRDIKLSFQTQLTLDYINVTIDLSKD